VVSGTPDPATTTSAWKPPRSGTPSAAQIDVLNSPPELTEMTRPGPHQPRCCTCAHSAFASLFPTDGAHPPSVRTVWETIPPPPPTTPGSAQTDANGPGQPTGRTRSNLIAAALVDDEQPDHSPATPRRLAMQRTITAALHDAKTAAPFFSATKIAPPPRTTHLHGNHSIEFLTNAETGTLRMCAHRHVRSSGHAAAGDPQPRGDRSRAPAVFHGQGRLQWWTNYPHAQGFRHRGDASGSYDDQGMGMSGAGTW